MRNLFVDRHVHMQNGVEVDKTVPSPFKKHIVTPLKNARTRASNSGIGNKVRDFFKSSSTAEATSSRDRDQKVMNDILAAWEMSGL